MQEEISKVLYEKLIINYLFRDEDMRSKLIPYLDPSIFMNHKNSQVIKEIMSFMRQHEVFPKISEMKLYIQSTEVYNNLQEIMDIDTNDYSKEFVMNELEEFFRKSLIANVLIDANENLDSLTSKLQDYPDKMREALAFSFDTNIGTSFLDDAERMFDEMHDKDKVLPTGIKSLDELTEGGSHEKSLNLILAGINVGKSLSLCSLAVNFLLQNKNVLYLSLEMTEQKIFERIVANMFDVNISDLKMMDKRSFLRKHEYIKKTMKSNFIAIQYGAKSLSSNKIRAILKDLWMKKKFKPDVIVVDYLGLMATNSKSKDANSYNELKTISEELRAIAVEESSIIWSAMQVNRGGIKNVELDVTDIADSIGTAATADLIIGLTTTDELKQAGRYAAMVIKNRYGLNQQKIYIGVNYPKMRIYDIDVEDDENSTTQTFKSQPQSKSSQPIVDDMAAQALKSIRNNSRAKINNTIGIE